MPEPTRSDRAWLLLRMSVQLLRANKKLMFFPFCSLVFLGLIAVLFFGTGFLKEPVPAPTETAFVAFYFLLMFLSTFANVAFTHEALLAFNGSAVSLTRGFSFARRRFAAILFWSLFAGLVGLAIGSLERRFGFFGKLVLRFVSLSWSIASVFVIPVMIREGSRNPLKLLRASASTVRKSWGDTLVAYVGAGLAMGGIVFTVVLVVFVAGIFFEYSVPAAWLPVLEMSGILLLIAALTVSGAVEGLFCSALYIYATEGVAPAPYSSELLDTAWQVRDP